MRLFFLTSILTAVCSLSGCAGELPETMVDPAKAAQLGVGTEATPPAATQPEEEPSTTSFNISVSITIDSGETPDGNTDAQETTAE